MLKLHFAPNSRAERILWLLEELELPYELNEMAFSPSDLKSDEHRARHPLGRIPVLDDGDIQIWDVTERKRLVSLEEHEGLLNSLDFSPKGGVLANQKKRSKGESERWRGVKRWFRRSKRDERD